MCGFSNFPRVCRFSMEDWQWKNPWSGLICVDGRTTLGVDHALGSDSGVGGVGGGQLQEVQRCVPPSHYMASSHSAKINKP